ncbi:tyrosine-type recombinase/integrase [Kordiimonas sp.]|uniref:tyrosine-type recombinase/integrase n=1 Tax=Kordiimonas sp. TaxID=1970157 RepID=UPI003A940254
MSAAPEVATFCAVLAYTGARVSEILALSPDRIDFDDEIIVIESLKKRCRGHFRTVPVPRELLRTLDAVHNIKADQQRHRCANRMLWPWCRTTAWSRVKEIMRAAGVNGPMASPKGLRHSLGVSAIQSGVPLNMVQKWLGQTNKNCSICRLPLTTPTWKIEKRHLPLRAIPRHFSIFMHGRLKHGLIVTWRQELNLQPY